MSHRLGSSPDGPEVDIVIKPTLLPGNASSPNGLVTALRSTPYLFLQPSLPLHTDALKLLRDTLDPVAVDVAEVQRDRQREDRRKRKRGERQAEHDILRIKQIHTDGFSMEQVWEQARRVIDAMREEAEYVLNNLVAVEVGQGRQSNNIDGRENVVESSGEEGRHHALEEHHIDSSVDDDEDDSEVDIDGLDDYDMAAEDSAQVEDADMDEGEDSGNFEQADQFIADKFGLNDGFFSIDQFNRQSEFLEQQDTRGDDGTASEEEDVDWDADPFAKTSQTNKAGLTGEAMDPERDDDDDDDDDDDGPTFDEPDATSEDEDEQLDDEQFDAVDGVGNANDIMYADFFAPPAQKKAKHRTGRYKQHSSPNATQKSNPQTSRDANEDDVERTMAAVHRDLFEDDGSDPDEDDDDRPLDTLDPSDPRSRKSTHERRKAALAEEIRKLEAANIAKREWTLSGEARAADRPLNSLLEEDLDFERTGKPVPVITSEVSESIEDLIKRRILAQDFQDLVRRRPDDLVTGKGSRRGRLEFQLDDSKSKKGLAEEYEEEYTKRTDPNYVHVQDEKLQKEQKEIEGLWKDVCAKLDSLSSWHFRPKAPTTNLEIRVDAPTIQMEDARPSAGAEAGGASQLAPQEVYRAGESTAKNSALDVSGKSGLPAAREELTREDKKRKRRREKERIRKASGNQTRNVQGNKGDGKTEMLNDLKRGNVKVIGKKGEVSGVDGKEAKQGGGQGASQYKL